MNIYVGADHRGVALKSKITGFLESQGYEISDVGTFDESASCDYPQIALDVATQVAHNHDSRGILVCMSGIGHSIAANKVPGAYAALVYNREAAALSRQHNNSNILVLGSKFVSESEMMDIITIWLSTQFEGGRHQRRIDQIKDIERKYLK